MDVGPRGVPANHLPLFVSEGVIADQKPALLAVLPQGPHFRFKRQTAFKSSLPLLPQSLEVLRMENSFTKMRSEDILSTKTRKVECRLVSIERRARWVQNN